LNDLEGHSLVAGLSRCNSFAIYVKFQLTACSWGSLLGELLVFFTINCISEGGNAIASVRPSICFHSNC